jgi:hypothetical protein
MAEKLKTKKTKGDGFPTIPLSDAPLESRTDSFEEVMARIKAQDKKFKKSVTSAADVIPDHIYFYDIKQTGFNFVIFRRFHGKCGFTELQEFTDAGYTVIPTGSLDPKNKDYSRTTCEKCGEQLNSKLAKQLIAEQLEKSVIQKTERERRNAIELERQKELVFLGKL